VPTFTLFTLLRTFLVAFTFTVTFAFTFIYVDCVCCVYVYVVVVALLRCCCCPLRCLRCCRDLPLFHVAVCCYVPVVALRLRLRSLCLLFHCSWLTFLLHVYCGYVYTFPVTVTYVAVVYVVRSHTFTIYIPHSLRLRCYFTVTTTVYFTLRTLVPVVRSTDTVATRSVTVGYFTTLLRLRCILHVVVAPARCCYVWICTVYVPHCTALHGCCTFTLVTLILVVLFLHSLLFRSFHGCAGCTFTRCCTFSFSHVTLRCYVPRSVAALLTLFGVARLRSVIPSRCYVPHVALPVYVVVYVSRFVGSFYDFLTLRVPFVAFCYISFALLLLFTLFVCWFVTLTPFAFVGFVEFVAVCTLRCCLLRFTFTHTLLFVVVYLRLRLFTVHARVFVAFTLLRYLRFVVVCCYFATRCSLLFPFGCSWLLFRFALLRCVYLLGCWLHGLRLFVTLVTFTLVDTDAVPFTFVYCGYHTLRLRCSILRFTFPFTLRLVVGCLRVALF